MLLLLIFPVYISQNIEYDKQKRGDSCEDPV